MNKKLIISLGLVVALSTATISAMADTTIYTDGIGRLHFLGKDAASSTGAKYNYANPAQQELTRKLYDEANNGVVNDTTYDQHPLKNYENTFPDSRFSSSKIWKTKYANGDKDVVEESTKSVKATTTATKGQTDYSGQYAYGSTFLNNTDNEVKAVEKKKHWWNRK